MRSVLSQRMTVLTSVVMAAAPVNESSSSANACSSCTLYCARVSGSLRIAYACIAATPSQISKRDAYDWHCACVCTYTPQRVCSSLLGITSFRRMHTLWPFCPRKSGWHDFARARYAILMTSGGASSSTCGWQKLCLAITMLSGGEAAGQHARVGRQQPHEPQDPMFSVQAAERTPSTS